MASRWGDRLDAGPTATAPRRRYENRLSQAVPGRVASAGGLENAAVIVAPTICANILRYIENGLSKVGGIGWAANLVGNHAKPVGFLRRVQHRANENRANRGIRPGSPQHQATRARCQHGLLAGQFGGAINAGTPWLRARTSNACITWPEPPVMRMGSPDTIAC